MASHGLSAAYSAGNDETKELLVNALVEKLQMAGPALQAARTDAASKVPHSPLHHPRCLCGAAV